MGSRGGKRPGAGRKAAGGPHLAHLHIRVELAELERWHKAATSAGYNTLSEWVRMRLSDNSKPPV